MREKQIEQKLVQEARKNGGICLKLISPGFSGMPDRLLLLPHGRAAFVEVKAPGEKPRPLQTARHGMLRRLGFKVYVLDGEAQIEKIISETGGWCLMKFIPHDYQKYAIRYIESHRISAVLLDMGLG